jgi:hypothetical protein
MLVVMKQSFKSKIKVYDKKKKIPHKMERSAASSFIVFLFIVIVIPLYDLNCRGRDMTQAGREGENLKPITNYPARFSLFLHVYDIFPYNAVRNASYQHYCSPYVGTTI